MISIVIPAFRHAHYIPQTIFSVLSQPVPELELIIINDGSPDETAQVIVPFLSDPRVTYLEQDNQGQAAARNRGLALAKGEFIKFLDDDDVLPPDALEWAISLLMSHSDVAGVVGGVQYIDSDGMPIGALQSGHGHLALEDVLTARYPMASPGQAIFRTSAIRGIGGFDTTLRNVDDFDLYCRLVQCGKLIIDDRLSLKYRWHGGNASSDTRGMVDAARGVIGRHLASLKKSRRSAVRRQALALVEANYGMSAAWKEVSNHTNARSKFQAILGYMVRSESTLWLSPLWWKSLLRRIKHTRSGWFNPS